MNPGFASAGASNYAPIKDTNTLSDTVTMSTVAEKVDNVNRDIRRIEDVIGTLRMRLSPVLLPELPSDVSNAAQCAPVPLVEELHVTHQRLLGIEGSLIDILSRLAV